MDGNQVIAQRARLLTLVYANGNSALMASKLRVSPQSWNYAETGRGLGIKLAGKIIETFPGLTLDWIYRGRREGLSAEVDSRLRQVESTLSGKATTGG